MSALLTYLQSKHAAAAKGALSIFDDEQAKFDETFARVLEETGSEQMALLAANGAVRRMRRGLPVKAEKVDGQVYVSGWGILFADAYSKDLHGEYFPRDGEFFLDYYANAPLFFEHSADNRYKWEPVGVRVGWQVYEHGIWFTHRLFAEHPLFDRTAALVKEGKLSYSSDSVAHVVMRGETDDGGLKVWPLIGFSLVRNPAEPGLGNVIAEGASE